MPNPLFLKVMNVKISEYNAYSDDKKARFQRIAAQRLAEVHSTDIEAYKQLTEEVANPDTNDTKSAWEVEE